MRVRGLSYLAIACVLGFFGTVAPAQTATPTGTATAMPTNTATPYPTPPPPVGAGLAPLSESLFQHQATAAISNRIGVAHWYHKSAQVTVSNPCTNYSLSIEGWNGGTQWALIGSAVTEATVTAGASKLISADSAATMLRLNLTAINTCDISVTVAGTPQ